MYLKGSNSNVNDEVKSDIKVHCIDAFYTEHKLDGKRMIIDNGAPLSLTGTPWLNKYLKDNNITREDLAKDEVEEHLRF